MAAALTLSITISSDPRKPPISLSPTLLKHPFVLPLRKPHRLFATNTTTFSAPTPSTTTSTSTTTTTTTATKATSPASASTASDTYSLLEDTFRTGRFFTNEELETLKKLQYFNYYNDLKAGSISIRVMRSEETDETVKLLAESFADSMLLPGGYVGLLRFLVRQYLIERRGVLPHAVTLVGFYRETGSEEESEELAGTVEVCFDKRGANDSPPSPTPPKDQPYICNMTVTQPLRRRGIGWNLLKASEELISQICCRREVYLHCRMIDSAPFNMYRKAGYDVVKTDSILVLLMLQRRKHLMRKELPVSNSNPELDSSGSDMQLPL